MEKGLVHIYYGNGKGKTTAAIGLAIRAAGNDMSVVFAQFLKSAQTGEINAFSMLPQINVLRGDESCTFTFTMDAEMRKKCLSAHNAVFGRAVELCHNNQVDLLVLDEIIDAYSHDLINKEQLVDFIKNKPESVEVVLTGRNPACELVELADYVSEIRKIRHPFDKGVRARIGIEK